MTGLIPGDSLMKKPLFFIMLIFLAQPAWSADVFYVQSATAKLLGQPSFRATLIENLDRGTALDAIEVSGRWIKVKHNEKVGWIPRLLLSKAPPITRPSLLEGHDDQLDTKARRRASSSATAAATRGLRNEDRSRMSDEQHSDYDALQKVDHVTVKQDDVIKFQQEGLKQQ